MRKTEKEIIDMHDAIIENPKNDGLIESDIALLFYERGFDDAIDETTKQIDALAYTIKKIIEAKQRNGEGI